MNDTLKLEVGRILRDYPYLRGLHLREIIWQKVKQAIPSAKFSSVERNVRHFQNTLGLYLPEKVDNRYFLEQDCKEFYGKVGDFL